ncbi:MAG: rhodanese-like domain-containing protein [Bacteroidales bacterium]|jgi:rhodanese-related sulfurtransferase|nr:rhodanese-like domain-containing protein [Bacteroidales bacterium]
MKNSKILMLSIAFAFLFFACSEDEVTSVIEAEVLVEYLETTGGTVVNTFPQMIKSTDVNTAIITSADQYIIDIRSAADYDAGHIEGAVNVASGEVLAYYETNNLQDKETVVLVCYSGQTAGWVSGLLHTMGYNNVKDLKWAMCSWNEATSASWPGNISNAYATALVTESTAKAEVGNFPKLNTGETDAEDILRARVEAIFAEGFGEAAVQSSAVFESLDNYYIVNYWSEADYSWNHIPGAIQYTPAASLTSNTFLKTLPTDKTIAVYCYTGQTSAHVAAYLRVLGYDAKTVKFGVNGMSYDAMPGTKWADTEIHDYELVQ